MIKKESDVSTVLEIDDLHVTVDNKPILKGLNLKLEAGKVYAMMGPNGAGKSTFANLLARKEGYTVTQGQARYLGEDLLALTPEEAAWKGLFLSFQYPVSIPGVTNIHFLKSALNALLKARGQGELDAVDFLALVKEKMNDLQMPESFLYRFVNEGFSGGEKKRNEILQMSLFNPTLALLDETDSGLDIDALKVIANGINHLRNENRAILLITHYQRLLSYIEPDFVFVLSNGKIAKSGDKSLALALEEKGYADFKDSTE